MDHTNHRETCCGYRGAWGLRGKFNAHHPLTCADELKGSLSLADTLLISAVAQSYVARNRKVLSKKTTKLLARHDQPGRPLVKQVVIYIDLTDLLPEARHDVYAQTSYIPEGTYGDVLIEVSLCAGRTSFTRTLPFAYDSKLLNIYARV